jgi:hypothetical protein
MTLKEETSETCAMDDPIAAACSELLKQLRGQNIPLTLNSPAHQGVVFAYSGVNWELFSDAIMDAVDQVRAQLSESTRR